MSVEVNLKKKLNLLYDKLDVLGDLRNRGYPVTLGEVSQIQRQIKELESILNES